MTPRTFTRAATTPQRRNPVTFHATAGLVVGSALTVLLWWLLSARWSWQAWLFAWLVGINLTAFGYYGFDKVRSRRVRTRVPEVVLHFLALIGGSLGAYAGMQTFRHKTLKGRFQFWFWCIVVVQVGVIFWVVNKLWLAG